jgi:hypothetical protein
MALIDGGATAGLAGTVILPVSRHEESGMAQGRENAITVTLPCTECGSVVTSVSGVAVVCLGGVAREVSFTCPSCQMPRSVPAGAASLSLLHRAGARSTSHDENPAHEVDLDEVEAGRQVVSLRMLLDEPDFLARIESTTSVEMPQVPGADTV